METALFVEPLECSSVAEAERGLSGGDPASISRWIADFDALPPLRMSDVEEAEWQST
jgi:hypothetical protein